MVTLAQPSSSPPGFGQLPGSGNRGLTDRIASSGVLDRPAVVGADGTLTYGQLYDRAVSLAGRFGSNTAPVLLYGHKQPAMVVAILAALQAGRPYLPVDPTTPTERIARIVEIARPGTVVAVQPWPPDLRSLLDRWEIPVVELDSLAAGPRPEPKRDDRPGWRMPDQPAYILFTSGTTGDPKGVAVSYGALTHFVAWVMATYDFGTGEDVFLNQVPYTFDVSIVGLYGSLLSGGTLFSLTHDDIANPRKMFSRLADAPLTVWVSTPSLIRMALAEPRFNQDMLPRLRLFWVAGEPLPPNVVRELFERFPRAEVWNAYGPTEATVVVTAARITPAMLDRGRPLPIGLPLPGADVWIDDLSHPGRKVPDGQSGEIVIGGPQVALGYLLSDSGGAVAPPSPDGRFYPLPDGGRAYRTGDLGYRDAHDGMFYCGGRLDRQVKLHGFRIELEEIETFLRQVPGVGDAAVLVAERDGSPDYLVACLVPSADSGAKLPSNDLELTRLIRSELATRLPAYALPRRARLISSPPLGSSGKLDRKALQSMLR